MLNGYRAIDSDIHILEPPDLLERDLQPRHAGQLPTPLAEYLPWSIYGEQSNLPWDLVEIFRKDGIAGLRQTRDGELILGQLKVIYDRYPEYAKTEYNPPESVWTDDAWGPDAQLDYMDRVGLDLAFIYPSYALRWLAFDGMDETGAEIAGTYNDWIADFSRLNPARLRPVGVVSLHNPQAAVKEARRVATELKFSGIVLPNCPDGKTIGHADFEPLWDECERLGLSVSLHVTARAYKRGVKTAKAPSAMTIQPAAINSRASDFETLLRAGVFERHPNLRVGLLECHAGWLPHVLYLLDEALWQPQLGMSSGTDREMHELRIGMSFDELTKNVTMSPADYFRRQCWIHTDAEISARYVADLVGSDRLLWATDFPHYDGPPPERVAEFAEFGDTIGDDLVGKILWDNPLQFYGTAA